MADDKKRQDGTADDTEPAHQLRLDKETLKDLEPENSEKVKGGAVPTACTYWRTGC